MTSIWFSIIIAVLAWCGGWIYGSSGAWNEGYNYGQETMQLMLQGDQMTADRVLKSMPKPRPYDYNNVSEANYDEPMPTRNPRRLTVVK